MGTSTRTCEICGKSYRCWDSAVKHTCSKECASVYRSRITTGKTRKWNPESRANQSKRLKGTYTEQAKNGLKAAMALPDSQRGEQHRDAKMYTLIDPSGIHYEVTNLRDWARKNAYRFEDEPNENSARNIASGFNNIYRYASGARKKAVYSYKGWTVEGVPKDKPKNQDDE